jgi:TPR repeat protein
MLACLGTLFLLTRPVLAYDEGDCVRQETVPVTVDEAFSTWSDLDAARKRALDRTNQIAIGQVIGFEVKSSRENRAEIVNSDAEQRFKQFEQTNYAGLVRVKILEETRKDAETGGSVSIRSDVTVCVPKSQAQKKEEQERADRRLRPPKPVDPTTAAWFDPVTGQPQVWYWREGQTYEFFDNSGFHPRTGDKLLIVDRKVVTAWRQSVERAKREAVERVQREAAQREAEAQRQAKVARAGELCDQTAAGPYDPDRPRTLPGVPWDVLKGAGAEAIEACEIAVRQYPEERRYRYQLARAYQTSDPKKALPLLQVLMRQNYRAAYDNFGWALLDTRVGRNDLAGAVASFRQGAALGDPDAMVSLATMISKGRVEGAGPDEAFRLFKRAAAMGHRDAAEAVERLMESQRQAEQQRLQAEQQRLQNEQAARAFMGLVGGALGGLGRR